jgi:hypothetical protein
MPDQQKRDPLARLEAVAAEARAQAARARATIEQAHLALDRSRHTVMESRRFVKGRASSPPLDGLASDAGSIESVGLQQPPGS